jgi:hypothetical protein
MSALCILVNCNCNVVAKREAQSFAMSRELCVYFIKSSQCICVEDGAYPVRRSCRFERGWQCRDNLATSR